MKITSCRDCPFFFDGMEQERVCESSCSHPKQDYENDANYIDVEAVDYEKCVAENCPLRTESITIELANTDLIKVENKRKYHTPDLSQLISMKNTGLLSTIAMELTEGAESVEMNFPNPYEKRNQDLVKLLLEQWDLDSDEEQKKHFEEIDKLNVNHPALGYLDNLTEEMVEKIKIKEKALYRSGVRKNFGN